MKQIKIVVAAAGIAILTAASGCSSTFSPPCGTFGGTVEATDAGEITVGAKVTIGFGPSGMVGECNSETVLKKPETAAETKK